MALSLLSTLLAGVLVLTGGDVVTLDPERPRAEALLAIDGKIVLVGTSEEVRARAAAISALDVRRIDLAGRTVLPGLVDAHGHLSGLGALELGALDLHDAQSEADVVAAVRDAAKGKKPGEWITGSRWDHESWPSRALPTLEGISQAAPANPVYLSRVDGHMALVNGAALALAGLTAESPNPPGGAILRGKDGLPNGLLVDNAIDLVTRKMPAGAHGSAEDLLLAAERRCFAVGLTGVHDAGIGVPEAEALKKLAQEGRLRLRVHAMVFGSEAGLAYVERTRPASGIGKTGNLSIRAVKLMADGAMGSRGAWLLEPYADRPVDEAGKAYLGLPVTAPDALAEATRRCAKAGYQVATHAIGDRANRETLSAYERAYGSAEALRAARARVEHAQLIAPEDLPRFAKLSVIASMQPTHATSDMRWAERRVGKERLRGAYAWASLLRSGAKVAFGSDFPVEAPEPLAGIYAAATREDAQGEPKGGWLPAERVSREEALRAFTEGAAFASFDEGRRGRLAPGMDADLGIWPRSPLTCDAPQLLTMKPDATVVAGEVVFEVRGAAR